MQLKKIKLAGFKSFVDPTTVLLPSNLVAIVGPNGCGKSNIIDAISWVMGESSAKYLRGELLTDVIFNGSSTRKPIGQSTVELIFDNQDGSLGGEYGNYAEISIKRLITRNGDSSYFLNGARCRRKDIIDIFLGTGLGPRSYSIIGQNMISRLIEAKPDEMRVYLEEAAGISKYKERRRETENRIHHTKENLARLTDVRTELEKQLNTLQRQANTAERFKLLKQEERMIKGQWHAIQWRKLDGQLIQYTLQIQQQETGMEARHAEFGEMDQTLETKREEQRLAAELFSNVQRNYYTIGNDITRIEQDIRYQQERQQQLQNDFNQTNTDWQELSDQVAEIEDQLTDLTTDITMLEPEAEEAAFATEKAEEALSAADQAVQTWQTQWDEFNQQTAKVTQTAQVEQTRIQHLEQKFTAAKQRQAKLTDEAAQLNFTQLEEELAQFSAEEQTVSAQLDEQDEQLKTVREEMNALQSNQQLMTTHLDQVRHESQKMRGQQASLEALQQTALGQRNNQLSQWLSEQALDQKPRLAQGVEVEAGWEVAAEKVLGSYLQAICVDDIAALAPSLEALKKGSVTAVGQHHIAKATISEKGTTLLSKIVSKWPLDSLLAGIYVADSLSDALILRETLDVHESIITKEGAWIGASWIQLSREEDPAAGIFQREQELKQLALQIAELSETQATLEADLEALRDRLKGLDEQREQWQLALNQSHTKAADIKAQQKIREVRLNELKNRAAHITDEQEKCIEELETTQTDLMQARSLWQQAMTQLEQEASQRETLLHERNQARETLQRVRTEVNQAKDHASQLQIRLQTARSEQGSLKQTMARMQNQMTTLTQRKMTLEQELDAVTSLDELEKTLTIALEKRLVVETELNTARLTMETIEQEMRLFESQRQALEREMSKIRDMLETLRLESQGLKIKSETLIEQIKEMGLTLEEIISDLPETAEPSEWQTKYEQITQRITRLGPINLIAIEEYATCSERKEYLDKQFNDLQEGLTTLENAIAKIDKETRARFKETFDKVNDRFQELFPAIFGGGKAYLELTGENLLDAGITVMACPPGKRNSTIHLLSGGEKALTAIALVFSIFHLNPAPFCLLDEVDAPLDDANIGRFCQLVKTMAEKTQFIFISHNKLAIEMAEHLMGVTMHEPGVSRLVSVDVKEAIDLAGA